MYIGRASKADVGVVADQGRVKRRGRTQGICEKCAEITVQEFTALFTAS